VVVHPGVEKKGGKQVFFSLATKIRTSASTQYLYQCLLENCEAEMKRSLFRSPHKGSILRIPNGTYREDFRAFEAILTNVSLYQNISS
jgi:hypothetical protein